MPVHPPRPSRSTDRHRHRLCPGVAGGHPVHPRRARAPTRPTSVHPDRYWPPMCTDHELARPDRPTSVRRDRCWPPGCTNDLRVNRLGTTVAGGHPPAPTIGGRVTSVQEGRLWRLECPNDRRTIVGAPGSLRATSLHQRSGGARRLCTRVAADRPGAQTTGRGDHTTGDGTAGRHRGERRGRRVGGGGSTTYGDVPGATVGPAPRREGRGEPCEQRCWKRSGHRWWCTTTWRRRSPARARWPCGWPTAASATATSAWSTAPSPASCRSCWATRPLAWSKPSAPGWPIWPWATTWSSHPAPRAAPAPGASAASGRCAPTPTPS